MSELDADAIVVGSGAGGAPVALTLARAGASVLLLERGPRYTRRQFVHDEVRIARRDFFVPSADTDPHVVVEPGTAPRRTNEGWVASCVGGGTVHMSGFFYRFHPVDFRVRQRLGDIPGATVADWPITYDDLAPYYDQMEREIGVSGPADEGPHAPPRQAPYPLPPVDVHPAAALLDAGARRLGLHPFPTPRAIISRDYDGRARCAYCHLCGGFGCEVGAKGSTLDTLIPKAEATGKCRVLADTRVVQVLLGEGDRVDGVLVRVQGGGERRLRARVVVLACSAIETVRLLLLSESPRFPRGLANDAGQVGRHLMFSTLAKAMATFRYDRDAGRAQLLRDHAPFLGRSLLDYYVPKAAPVAKAGALNFLFPSGGPIFQSESVAARAGLAFGEGLVARLRSYWHEGRQLECEAFGEYLPTPGTRVELDPQVRDEAGLAAARMTIERHAHDLRVAEYLAARAAEVLRAAGADDVWTEHVGGATMHLPMGGCRMAARAEDGVVDATGRAHSVKNLFVTDGSVFPSSGGVPPTLTILANAARVGAHVRDAMARREL